MTPARVENQAPIPGSRTLTTGAPQFMPSLLTPVRGPLPALSSVVHDSHSPYYGYDNFISIREEEPFMSHIPDNFRRIDQNGGKTR